jgi:tetraacyldisaccharide 4'-kinase
MKFLRFLLFPIALIYGLITWIRNGFYRKGIFKASKFSVPIINVGNLSMGGTGKTPHTEYLIRLLKSQTKLVTLSRGFGRRERGFILADETANARKIGDEPFQYYRKFKKDIHVAVDANRVMGVMDICRNLPETELILLDDAFQHRAIQPGLNILITPLSSPYYQDYLFPVGNLRELRSGMKRADIIVVSKCGSFNSLNKSEISTKLKVQPHQHIFYSKVNYGALHALNGNEIINQLKGRAIILVTGIANPKPLVAFLEKNNRIIKHFNFNDHHNFKIAEIAGIHNIFDKFASENPLIVTTEKDAMRLISAEFSTEIEHFPWFFQTIEVEIEEKEKFDKIIFEYVGKASRND